MISVEGGGEPGGEGEAQHQVGLMHKKIDNRLWSVPFAQPNQWHGCGAVSQSSTHIKDESSRTAIKETKEACTHTVIAIVTITALPWQCTLLRVCIDIFYTW